MFANLNIAYHSPMYTRHGGNLFYDSKYFFLSFNRLIDNPAGDQYYFTVLSHIFNDK